MDHFEVNDFVENEDGSATITVTMDYETLLLFARKGLISTLVDAANKVIENESQDRPVS
jgi:hypothetical protein